MRTCTLTDLPGARFKTTEAALFTTVDGAIGGLQDYDAVKAENNGCEIKIWIDGHRKFRAEVLVQDRAADRRVFAGIGDLKRWLRIWLPKIK